MEARDVLRPATNTLVPHGFRLLTLGTVTLVDQNGVGEPTLARRRRKLAMLAVLALARRPVGRDRLSEMFWGDEEDSRARHSLADSLSNLRRVLGPDSLATRQFEIALAPDCPLTVDVLDLIDAHQRRDFPRVIELYGGSFLGGIAIPGSASFERWVGEVRDQVHDYWIDACSNRCLALARTRRWSECAAIARRWLVSDPTSPDATLYLLNALKAPATPESYTDALAEYDRIERRLADELGRKPTEEVVRLVASIRDQAGSLAVDIVARHQVSDPRSTTVPATTPVQSEPLSKRVRSRSRRVVASRAASFALAVLLFMASTSFTAAHAGSSGAAMGRPVVAVVGIRAADRAPTTTWLEHTITQLVVSQVARAPGVDVMAPDFVTEARAAVAAAGDRGLSPAELSQVGRRIGARWVAVGQVGRSDTVYTLHLIVRDVERRVPDRFIRASNADLLALSDHAGAALASIVSAPASR